MKKLENKDILYYSLMAMPLAIIGIPLFIYLPTFYAVDINIDIAIVGLVLFLARLSDVISDPVIGYLSDLSLKHLNSRKPLIILGYILLLVSFYFIINPIEAYKIAWLLIFSILLYFAWSMIQIPYLTFSSELSNVYYEKTKLNSSREIFSILGMVLALVIPFLLATSNENKEILELLFYSFLVLSIPFFIISLLKIKPKVETKSDNISFKTIKEIYQTFPQLKYLQLGYFFNNLANAIPATLFLLFISVVIDNKDASGLVLIIYFIAGIIALPFWTLLSKKISKKSVWLSSIVLASCAFFFVIFLGQGDLTTFIIISIISGLSLGADMAFPTSIQADVVQKFKNFNISGRLFSLWTMLTKLSLALAVAITFVILGLVGFEESNPNELSILTLSLLYGSLPIILKLIAIFFITKYNENL